MPGKFELAKSSRSTCKKCKEKIQKDIPRYGEETVFTRDGNQYTSYKWYHFDCAVQKFGEQLSEVEEGLEILTDEQSDLIKKFQQKATESAFSFKPISDFTGEEGLVNVRGRIIRALSTRTLVNEKGIEEEGRVLYIEDEEGNRGKVLLFESKDVDLKKSEPIFLLNALVRLGSDSNPEVVEGKETQIFFDESQLPSTGMVKKYISTAWDRPQNVFCEFQIAPSGRATCVICEEKISKGELKVIKPVWGVNEKSNATYAQRLSIHLGCILSDEHRDEVLHEAISRLSPNFLSENHEEFTTLLHSLKENGASSAELLDSLMR